MKRPGQPRRKVALARGKSPVRSSLPARSSGIRRKTRVRKSNPVAQAKKAARYKSYLSSAVWKAKRKAALERAGHRCEGVVSLRVGYALTLLRCPALGTDATWVVADCVRSNGDGHSLRQ